MTARVIHIRNMWDTIKTHPAPANKAAAFAIATPPVWMHAEVAKNHNLSGAAAIIAQRPVTFIEIVDVTCSPPSNRNAKDWRGLRSRRHMVLGFAHLKDKIMTRNLSPYDKKWFFRNGMTPPAKHKTKPELSTTSWFVLRDTGEIIICNCRKFQQKLMNMDEMLDRANEQADPDIKTLWDDPKFRRLL